MKERCESVIDIQEVFKNFKEKFYRPMLICFEGLDCCFKETNSVMLENILHNDFGLKVKRFEFPNYKSSSSFYIKKFLAGELNTKYKDAHMVNAYLLEQYYHWHSTIKKYIEKNDPDVIILDRFYYSNFYYNEEIYVSQNIWKKSIKNYYEFPEADIIFAMDSCQKFLTNYMKKKNKRNKFKGNIDIFEQNLKFLLTVQKRFKKWIKSDHNIHKITISKYGVARNKDEIFKDIMKEFGKELEVSFTWLT